MSATLTQAPPPILTKQEVAELFRVSQRTIERWRLRGVLAQPLDLPGAVRWRREDLVHLIGITAGREGAGGSNR